MTQPDAARSAPVRALLSAALLLAGLGAITAASPAATVTITLPDTVEATVPIAWRDLGVVTAETSERVTPTGTASPAAARGTVFFICCDEPTGFGCLFGCEPSADPPRRPVPAGTIVVDRSSGQRYRTLSSATISRSMERECDLGFLGGTCWFRSPDVEAVALSTGRAGNATAGRLAAPSARTIQGVRVRVRLGDPFAGGLDGDEPMLTSADVASARTNVTRDASAQTHRDAAILGRARALTILLRGERLVVHDGAARRRVGEAFPQGAYELPKVIARARARAIGYRAGQVRVRLLSSMRAQLPPGRSLEMSSLRIDEPVIRGGRATVRGRAQIVLDDLDALPGRLRGLDPDAAIRVIEERYGVGRVTIERSGFPLPRMPLRAARITIVTQPA